MTDPTVAIVHLREERPAAPEFQHELDLLNAATVRTVRELGWTPILIPAADIPGPDALAAAREADLVVLMGGEDVDPRLYGGRTDYPGSGVHESRADNVQIAIALHALQHQRPLLGICRGMQLINVAFGGTLIEHLPAELHRAAANPADPFVRTRVQMDPDAPLRADIDPADHVLCTHHQALGELGHGLVVAARSADGVIEAVVHESAPITAVQWHPEHPSTASTQLAALLKRLERQLREGAAVGVAGSQG